MRLRHQPSFNSDTDSDTPSSITPATTIAGSSPSTPKFHCNPTNIMGVVEPLDEPHPYDPYGLSECHRPVATALKDMLQWEGAGEWPPRPSYHTSWPQCLEPYATIAKQAPHHFVSQLPVEAASSLSTILANREWITSCLNELHVDVDQVLDTIDLLSIPSRLGFVACIAYLNHLYRWGVLPIVTAAQDETSVDFPRQLSAPLAKLNHYYGIETKGGCLFTMTLLNVVDDDLAYSNMSHLAFKYSEAERLNGVLFYQIERLVFPFYRSIVLFDHWLERDETKAIQFLVQGNSALQKAFRLFFETLKEPKIPKETWMSHAQGFHGWGLQGVDGVSGDQSLLIRTLDALLSIPLETTPSPPSLPAAAPPPSRYSWIFSWLFRQSSSPPPPPPTKIDEIAYSNDHMPTYQRHWIACIRDANLRQRAQQQSVAAITELETTLRLFKTWRLGHMKRALYYEDLELQERRPMTAGSGVADKDAGLEAMLKKLEGRMKARINVTK